MKLRGKHLGVSMTPVTFGGNGAHQSGAEATAVQTLRAGWAASKRAKRLDCGGFTTAFPSRTRQSAFTLVELIIVMTLLVVVISVAAPSLAGFFRGRAVEAEARRMLSLTRLGQSRAVSAGVPMILWVDPTQRAYGLEEDSSYTDNDPKAVEYTLDGNVNIEIGANETARSAINANTLFGSMQSSSKHASLPQMRFLADGGVDETSRETFRLVDRDGGSVSLTLSSNRMNYEIHTQREPAPR